MDWSRSLAEMVEAGDYDRVNAHISEKNFPLSPPDLSEETKRPDRDGPYRTPGEAFGDGEVELETVHLNRILTTKQVLAELEAQGLRPATLPELLAFGERYPDVQRKFPAVALGSSWIDPGGFRRVPCLFGYSGLRGLDLVWGVPGSRWSGSYRFLAVRKAPHAALGCSGP